MDRIELSCTPELQEELAALVSASLGITVELIPQGVRFYLDASWERAAWECLQWD